MLNTGLIAKVKNLIDEIRYYEVNYIPTRLDIPAKLIQSKSQAWVGLEKIILDIIEFSGIKTDAALEFGVEFGYSSAVFANYFRHVKGVDIFTGDPHAGYYGNIYEMAKSNLIDFSNIELIKSDYKDYISLDHGKYDLIHVDIIHTYEDTYTCGLWAAQHSGCTLFMTPKVFPM